jgi:hypothetical protein
MKAFLKDNIALVAAIALPALLALVFFASTWAVKVSVEDPKHDFLIATDYNPGNDRLEFNVVDEKLQVTARALQKDTNGNPIHYGNEARLWRVHVPEMAIEEISIKRPTEDSSGEVSVPAVADLKVRNITPGPDGYRYEDSYTSHGGNLMTEIFAGGGRSYESNIAISKNGRFVSIRMPDENHYYYNTRFIGWIIEE